MLPLRSYATFYDNLIQRPRSIYQLICTAFLKAKTGEVIDFDFLPNVEKIEII